jgi:hypothetical protein
MKLANATKPDRKFRGSEVEGSAVRLLHRLRKLIFLKGTAFRPYANILK